MPLGRRLLPELVADDRIELVVVADPLVRLGKLRVVDQLGAVERGKDPPPLVVVDGQHADVAVLRRVGLAVLRQQADVADARGQRRVECAAPEMLEVIEREDRLEHRHVHFLAEPGLLALVQRHADRRGEHVAAQLVDDDRRVETRAVAVDLRHQRRDAALALDHVVVGGVVAVGPVLAIARAEPVDEARIALRQRFVVDAEALCRRGPHAVHEHVGRLDEAQQRVASRPGLQVERDAALVAVHVEVHGRHARVAPRTGLPVRVARGRLDLDHVGAHVAEDLRGDGAEHVDGDVDDADARERATRGLVEFHLVGHVAYGGQVTTVSRCGP